MQFTRDVLDEIGLLEMYDGGAVGGVHPLRPAAAFSSGYGYLTAQLVTQQRWDSSGLHTGPGIDFTTYLSISRTGEPLSEIPELGVFSSDDAAALLSDCTEAISAAGSNWGVTNVLERSAGVLQAILGGNASGRQINVKFVSWTVSKASVPKSYLVFHSNQSEFTHEA